MHGARDPLPRTRAGERAAAPDLAASFPGGSVARRTLSSLLAPAPPPPATSGGSEGEAPLLALVAREEDAGALRPLFESVRTDLWLPTVVVPLAELPRWQTRRARRAVGEAEGFLRARLARLRGMPGLHESYVHRGVGFADLAALDLDALLLGRLPVAVSLIETAAELLAASRPRVALLVVPSRDDRRALLTACARAGVSAVALRMGAAPPDDADRADGGPQPLAALGWEDGMDAVLARLRDAARATVEVP